MPYADSVARAAEKDGCCMKKRIFLLILAGWLILTLAVPVFGANSLSNFTVIRRYNDEFSDVSPDAWYYESVRAVFEFGIMDGRGGGNFDPGGHITIAETIRLAAVLHRGYTTGRMQFPQDTPWYAPYVGYALEHNFPISAFLNLNAPATRADFALIIAGAMPEEALTPKNRIADGAIPDVAESFSFGPAVYRLYRAGVLTGSDDYGTFFPGRMLLRSEAAAIIRRVISADARVNLSLFSPLTPQQVFRLASPAVFFIEIFDEEGEQLRTGSGFFICETGVAVTNYHVVVGGHTAKVTLADGDELYIYGISDYNRGTDIAIIKIVCELRESFPYLEIADSSDLITGVTIYTIGSPLGLQATFSMGIISHASRLLYGMQFIQIDAPISSGSSGGALLDANGRAIGITTATVVGTRLAQNLNMAVPINLIHDLSREEFIPLTENLYRAYHAESYPDHHPAPNFGAFFGVRTFRTQTIRGGTLHSYLISNLPYDLETILEKYEHLLEQRLFVHTGYQSRGAIRQKMFSHVRYNITVTFGADIVEGRDVVAVHLLQAASFFDWD